MTATAGFDFSHHRLQPAGVPRPGVVVRLHRQGPFRAASSAPVSRAEDAHPAHPAAADLGQLTRAVRAVVEALAPGMVAEVALIDSEPASAASRAPESRPGAPDLPTVPGEASAPASGMLGDEQIWLDRLSRTLLVDGVPVVLTKREFELLAHLAQHRGIALSRRELMNAVWHERYLPGDRTVDVHVRRVRVKLGDHADRLHTLRGFGYRFD